jgi:hypothetical protein
MAPYLVIEVLGGPLDGLRACTEKDSASIGRQVGNSLTLAIDQAVSGYHAEIVLEGNVWCLRDLGSTNGTWFNGARVEPKTSIPLESESQILVGTNSVIRVFLSEQSVSPLRFNSHKVDLRTTRKMEPGLADFFGRMYADQPAYLDASILFNRLGQDQNIGVLAGFFQQQELSDPIEQWIEQKRSANLVYRLDPDIVTIAPRVLQFFEECSTDELTLRGFVDGILNERGLCGKKNGALLKWLESYTPQTEEVEVEAVPEVVVKVEEEVASPVVEKAAAGPHAKADPVESPKPEPEATKPEPAPVSPAPQDDRQAALFLDFILQTEKIVLGFIKDAVHPTTVPVHFALPGFAYTAEEIVDKDDGEKTAKFLAEYLPVLISSLKVVLVAQREGAGNYPAKLDEQLTDILEEISKGSVFDQFRQSSTLPPADRIRGVLKSAETSGLGEHLIRERIREKMKIIRLTREER